MSRMVDIIALATALGAFGIWLLLPRRGLRGRPLGALLGVISLGLLASQLPGLGDWVSSSVFAILAGVTVIAAVGTVTLRNPVYSAIWFALSLLGTAGLFLFQGAQFLGVATVVVYAGAILVTFLFVLMLAQPEGHAAYDRLSWEAVLSAWTGALVVGILTLTVVTVFQNSAGASHSLAQADNPARDTEILAPQHIAHLGAQLFSQHLVGVEVAGTLLLVALVGCIAIVSQIKPAKAADPPAGRQPGNRRHG